MFLLLVCTALCNGIANDLNHRDHQDQNHHCDIDDVHPVSLLSVNIGVVAQAAGAHRASHRCQPDQADKRDRRAAGDSRDAFLPIHMEDDFKIAVSNTSAYMEAGNSIVVDVLIALLKQMDITKYGIENE